MVMRSPPPDLPPLGGGALTAETARAGMGRGCGGGAGMWKGAVAGSAVPEIPECHVVNSPER
jgi:hypothetical protein